MNATKVLFVIKDAPATTANLSFMCAVIVLLEFKVGILRNIIDDF